MVPATLHVLVAELCIKNGKNLVTASYISPEMEKLNHKAKESGVLLLNEIGLDPGLDHLAAMKVIDDCRSKGEEIESVMSWCGGLPAPESASSNPFGYKFSWSPRGVLLATQNSAKYLQEGQVHSIPGENLLKSVQCVKDLNPILKFEGIPNRDSLKYIKLYGLDKQTIPIKTMFRGTLRYKVIKIGIEAAVIAYNYYILRDFVN